MKAWYDDIDSATLQRIKTYSAFNDATSKNLMVQTMYEYREKEIQDFKETNHELAETCIARKKRITELEKENAELNRKLSKIQKMFEPQKFTDLMDEVEKEYADEQKINELEKENSRLNQIILGNEEEITDLRKDCEEYSKTFNRQNDEIISLRKELIELKNQIHKMRCCDNCCHCGGYTDEGGNSICDSCDDDMSKWEF